VQPTDSTCVCEVCGARVATLRRGRCWICYIQWSDGRPVGAGARCAICQDRRHENLRMTEFRGTWVPMCHNCAAKAMQLSPLPRTVFAVRERLSRDRRWKERRQGKKDHRIFAVERRTNERRTDPPKWEEIEWLDADDLIIEALDADDAPAEITGVRPLERS
jgi:hypothetical protein